MGSDPKKALKTAARRPGGVGLRERGSDGSCKQVSRTNGLSFDAALEQTPTPYQLAIYSLCIVSNTCIFTQPPD